MAYNKNVSIKRISHRLTMRCKASERAKQMPSVQTDISNQILVRKVSQVSNAELTASPLAFIEMMAGGYTSSGSERERRHHL